MDDDVQGREAMRPLDPLLLGSFPAPPTHIPVTSTSPNPPPSRPPSSPLPPIPGPSSFLRPSHRPNDSISSIDVRDILDATSDDDDDDRSALPPALPPLSRKSLADPILPITRSFTYPRSASPDIPTILSATPRPRAYSLKHRASQGLPSVAVTTSSPYGGIYAPASDDDDTRSWIDHDEFGRPLPPHWSPADEQRRRFAPLDGSDSDASDSSLDLHTPLPHLMMRHGLLSPNSRLITQPSPRDSVVSLASTKSTRPLKDARDTAKRRVRHRDGRLLRGGIGLTTGLGWSDSEDEDAPSPLTRRISSLNLSNRSSASDSSPSRSSSSSLPSSKSKPFTRSYSTTSLRSSVASSVDEFGKLSQPCPSAFKSNTTTTTSTSTRKLGRGRASTGSLTRTIPEDNELEYSSSSSYTDTFNRYPTPNREKSLPPLPRSSVLSTRTIPPRKKSLIALRSTTTTTTTTETETETRTRSVSGSSTGSTNSLLVPSRHAYAHTPDTHTNALKTPRPLRLSSPLLSSADSHMRCSPVPDSSPSPSTPSTPSPITPGEREREPARPRPRVGTGMTYRSSSSSISRMRLPSSMGLNVSLKQQQQQQQHGGAQKPIPL